MSDQPVVGKIEFAPFGNLTPEARPGDWKILAEGQNTRIERLERENAALREALDRRSATFQIVQSYGGAFKVVVISPNGDCCEFRARGERAERVLRDAAVALIESPARCVESPGTLLPATPTESMVIAGFECEAFDTLDELYRKPGDGPGRGPTCRQAADAVRGIWRAMACAGNTNATDSQREGSGQR